jgi:hypothetical protein
MEEKNIRRKSNKEGNKEGGEDNRNCFFVAHE